MTQYDVFNGDADGLCALQQLRLSQPQDSILITGVKRDIELLNALTAQVGDQVTVLDISLDKNRQAVLRLLAAGASIEYFDHHFAGEIPQHERLTVHIDTQAQVCSSLLVNHHLQGQYLAWAVVGAFGDNLFEAACQAALPLNYSEAELKQLEQLGTYLNYNGYGESLADLHYRPDDLFRQLQPYREPLLFIQQADAFARLQEGYQQDMAQAQQLEPIQQTTGSAVFILPNAAWARRCSGVLANQLARQMPNRAHALLTEQGGGSYLVSVRAPKANPMGADDLCRAFPTGGGRKAAAGINQLPAERYADFVQQFQQIYPALSGDCN